MIPHNFEYLILSLGEMRIFWGEKITDICASDAGTSTKFT